MTTQLCTIEDIELATGKTFVVDTPEYDRLTYYINVISAWIQSYCDAATFGIQDVVVRSQADAYGIVDLGGGPISAVATVTAVDGTELSGWSFDGTSQIYDLVPYQTVDIELPDMGMDVPADLSALAVEAVGGIVLTQYAGPITRREVGDVTYVFDTSGGAGGGVGVQLSQNILNRYRNTEFTWRTGSPVYRSEPYEDFQTGG